MKIKAKYLGNFDKKGITVAQFVNEFSDLFVIKAEFIGPELSVGESYLIEVDPAYWQSPEGKMVPFFKYKVLTRL